jgi:hypothetical protein
MGIEEHPYSGMYSQNPIRSVGCNKVVIIPKVPILLEVYRRSGTGSIIQSRCDISKRGVPVGIENLPSSNSME